MRILVAVLGLMVSLVACADSQGPAKYQEGKHYVVLDNPVRTANPNKIEVTEVFWYGCGHCFHFEPLVKSWKEKQADDVAFVRSPAMWNKTMELHARAFYTAKALGVLETLHDPIFDAMNVRKQRLANEAEIAELFVANGVDADKFAKVFNSFGVTGKVRQADARARSYRVTGTPELVVDGKYRISASAAGSQQAMLEVADFLVEKIRAERAK
ncbi:thiol:disulfide interchange protein DsbA/DsbL [Simiduia sp. 21SJ11W-1]|uniref:thiol:disulfide interchange protein DsbA/DsbL n=1 Tax=Simiduia sp. 21SJ11W-1 TaxID=2909669 RepID=UPI00209EE6DD|nr:thiol:disulfide interchange protein DsbA/DsbL [Simiduia sp. 21SJ11W-1]UTA47764.1 thiol:disulfide interchange protein DsbA/DsbL [Simiduia sp. 21SJ11W-1]